MPNPSHPFPSVSGKLQRLITHVSHSDTQGEKCRRLIWNRRGKLYITGRLNPCVSPPDANGKSVCNLFLYVELIKRRGWADMLSKTKPGQHMYAKTWIINKAGLAFREFQVTLWLLAEYNIPVLPHFLSRKIKVSKNQSPEKHNQYTQQRQIRESLWGEKCPSASHFLLSENSRHLGLILELPLPQICSYLKYFSCSHLPRRPSGSLAL